MSYASAHRRVSPTDLKSFNHQKDALRLPAKLCQQTLLDIHIKYLQNSKLDANCLQILIFHKLKPSTHRQHRQGGTERQLGSLCVRVHVQFSIQQEARERGGWR